MARDRVGSVWFGYNMADHLILWKQACPPEITTSLVTYKTLHSTISNSYLELAGFIAQNDMLDSIANIDIATVSSNTNNTQGLYWAK